MRLAITADSGESEVREERLSEARCQWCGSKRLRGWDYGNDHCDDCGQNSAYPDKRIPFIRPGEAGAHDRYEDYPEWWEEPL